MKKIPENPAGSALSQMLLEKLNFAKDPANASPTSTPPLSPSYSDPQSSKTSPEVKQATMTSTDASPVPPSLKPLLNSVVWYVHEQKENARKGNTVFLTNSADTAHLSRDFGIMTKTIHQLRAAISAEGYDTKALDSSHKKQATPPPVVSTDKEPKPLFSYEDESDEEEVVFKPRGRGAARPSSSARGSPVASLRGRGGNVRSPVPAFSAPARNIQSKPQIPIEEIDPDSFDRGGFGRGSVPLANTGNHGHSTFNGVPRGPLYRGNFTPAGPSRGGPYRGAGRGFERGGGRGRGRLFVP